jgi:hypothetical protein
MFFNRIESLSFPTEVEVEKELFKNRKFKLEVEERKIDRFPVNLYRRMFRWILITLLYRRRARKKIAFQQLKTDI